ncbi:hypothetical protein AAVH_27407, partial [Aphelenchoides avenae]
PHTIIVRPCLGQPGALRQQVRAMLHECIHVAIYADRRGDTGDHGVNYHSYRSILELTPCQPNWTHLDWLNYWFNFRR